MSDWQKFLKKVIIGLFISIPSFFALYVIILLMVRLYG